MTTFAEPSAATAPSAAVPSAAPADLLSRFRAAVLAAPSRTAVHAADGSLDFAALDRRTAALAGALRAAGVRRGDRVGVHLARTLDLPVALLAVWRAGAAYVPLDPAYPAGRTASTAADARLTAVVSADAAPPVPAGVTVLRPDATGDAPADAFVPHPLDSAYVIFTSGSTGRPKGVEVAHGSVAALVAALEESGAYRTGPGVVAWNASVSFDASVQQWARICRGDTLVVIDDERRADPAALVRLLAEHAVTDLDLTPSHWQLLREPFAGARVPRLFMGGEPVPARTWRELADTGVDAINLYGPTECTVDAITAPVAGPVPHLGEPLPGVRAHLLDARLAPVAAGTVGELYLSGPGLAHGYPGHPGLTAGRFVADPFAAEPGARMYRTGDQARRSADGLLEYVGRVDRQVKLRGFRVELGEVEHALAALPGVGAAAVTVHEPAPGDHRLAGYVTGAGLRPADLLAELRRTLPAHLVPATVTVLDALPLTPNGKTDHRALPAPAAAPAEEAAAGGGVAEQVAEVWRTVLGLTEVEPTDDFLSLGGHSLAALRVVHLLRRRLSVEIQLRQLLDAADLADFTEAVRRAAAAGPATARPALTARRDVVR
ncbi:non-ribosomal peptide synthetase [Streptomyces omiyaensis]|uniref:non-ribosomal peptide synthetase n=1 Tax=Streptomyces omiyaensis TaxID=68247 RepID=UPI0036FFE883